ncbi:homeobox domain-containing protein [Aspergillus lucknowensis]|uniref:Homeobox domain-containing protein n=1 Tax=Aspergillus lucknowensis TaxID=176173 RepID=A0ABR4LTY4_9EURO
MSVSGPCAWVSIMTPAATAHSSAMTGSWGPLSWNSEQGTSKPKVDLPALSAGGRTEGEQDKAPPVEMPPTMIKAENTFPIPPAAENPNIPKYPGGEVPLSSSEAQNSGQNNSLSKYKLKTLNGDNEETNIPLANEEEMSLVKSEIPDEVHEEEKDHSELNAGSSDDGAGSSVADDKKSSQIEKKKMKRFRLTHNQTRFLMSEFTRQAHPDAAHRERLSREIPGLTPRQVQVWFQNRRAKLKRLTSNDRERMLKSRALPDDFDTTQVLRTPFGSKISEAPGILAEGLPRLNDDDYVISPLSSASTTGPGFPSSDRGFESYQNRGAAATVPDLRSNRGAFPFPRSSSFSESSFSPSLQFSGRFSRPGAQTMGHPGIPYQQRPMDYPMNRPANGILVSYSQHRPLEGSVSPTGQSEQQMPYGMDNANQQIHTYQSPLSMPTPKAYGGLEMNSHMQAPGRTMPTLQHLPVSEASDHRSYPYEHHPYGIATGIPFTQANTSSPSLPASFPSESGHVSQAPVGSSSDGRMSNTPQVMDPLRTKYGHGYEYANYL